MRKCDLCQSDIPPAQQAITPVKGDFLECQFGEVCKECADDLEAAIPKIKQAANEAVKPFVRAAIKRYLRALKKGRR